MNQCISEVVELSKCRIELSNARNRKGLLLLAHPDGCCPAIRLALLRAALARLLKRCASSATASSVPSFESCYCPGAVASNSQQWLPCTESTDKVRLLLQLAKRFFLQV